MSTSLNKHTKIDIHKKHENKTNNLLQNNILTNSRSSFVKIFLKLWRTRSEAQQQFPGMVRHSNTVKKKN